MLLPRVRYFLQYLLVLISIILPFQGKTQQYNFLHYSVRDGLPHTVVNCIYQDRAGFMWFGTEAGAARFDGQDFEVFGRDNGMPGDDITAITETAEGVLFAVDSGVSVFHSGRFTTWKSSGNTGFKTINAFVRGAAGETLLATEKGLFLFDPQHHFRRINTGTPVDDLPVRAGYCDSKKNLWIGTERNGLFKLQYSSGKYTNMSFADQDIMVNVAIRGITELDNGAILIATSGNGLFQFDGNAITKLRLAEKIYTEFFTCVHKDMNGEIWLGTWGNGVINYSHGVFRRYGKENGLDDDVVTCIGSDRQGNSWFGTFSAGLAFFYGDQFTSLTVKDGLPDNRIQGIVQDDEGDMWFATQGGLVSYDGVDTRVFTVKDGMPDAGIGALTSDGKRIYAGMISGEVAVIENQQVKVYRAAAGAEPSEIISMAYTSDGSVWLGTVRKGLYHFQGGRIEQVNTGNQLQYNPIWSIHVSDDGRLWLGTEKGLFLMDNGNAIRPDYSGKAPPAQPVYSVSSDSVFIYFASERNGIWRYHRIQKKYQSFTRESDELGSNFTKGLLSPDAHTMYVTTILGVDRISFEPDTQRIRHYWCSEGIGTDNFLPGKIFRSRDGRIWFGSTDGVIVYQPSSERDKDTRPNVGIKYVWLFNQETDWTGHADSILQNGLPFEPELNYDENQVTFRLSAIQFGAGENIRYEYQLEGLEKKWNKLSSGNSVSYSNLPPGNYRFVVRAVNSNGAWSDPVAFRFSILEPFWETWWFFLIVLLILSVVTITLTFLYRRFRTDFIRRHRTFGDYQLNTARMVFLFGGIFYPISIFLCRFFTPELYTNLLAASVLGSLLIISGIGTYVNPFFRRYANIFSQSGFGLLVLYSLYLCHINHLHPVTVAILAVTLGGGGVVFDNIRATTVFSVSIVLAVGMLMYAAGSESQYNRWLLLLAVMVSIVIIYINVFTRLNLFNRLVFADTTINNSRSIVIAADEQGKIIFVSRSVRSLLGYTQEEVLGEGWWKIRTDDETANLEMRSKIMSQEGAAAVYVSPIKAKNGSVHWIQWSDTEIDGGIKVGIGLDVTDRHEIEERYRHIVEAANDLIYTADHRGNFTYVNEVATKLVGYNREELIGRHFTTLIHPEWVDEVETFYRKQFTRRTSNSYLEFPIITSSGEQLWIGQTVRTLFDERRPRFISGFQAIARDITEKKRYEEELEQLSLVASETLNGVLICKPSGEIEWVNEGFSRITGYTIGEVKGRLPGDVLAGDRTDRSAISQVREQSSNAEGFHREFLVYHKDGHEIWIAVTNTPIVDEHGKILKQIEIFNDITEKKRYEIQLNRYSARLETLNMAKQELLRSHTVEAIAQNVLGSLARRINYVRRASIALFDDYTGLADFYYVLRDGNHSLGKSTFTMESFRSIPILKKNQHFHVRDLTKEQWPSESDQENIEAGIRSYLVTPLYSQGQLIGSVNIGSGIADAITDDDIEMVREVADAMAGILLQLRYRDIIDQKNADIAASILYARRIQDAILPPEEMLRDQLGDLFVLYRPKDMLSGDFYWAEKLGEYTFLAVADSTGHGVPGALLSMMGQNLLNQAVQERHLVRPSAILDYLNAGIQHTLNQYKKAGELRDGMDISLCVFQEGSSLMQFAGAVNPMYIIREGMLIQSKGNRFSVGSYFDNKMRPFTNQETQLQSGDVIYIFSDGYPDQFGGPEDRKLSHRGFRELLMRIHREDMQKQKELLENFLKSWMTDNQQTDDICVIGLRIR